jgi:hypothetical protein
MKKLLQKFDYIPAEDMKKLMALLSILTLFTLSLVVAQESGVLIFPR